MRIASKKSSQRIINAGFAFILALSTVTTSMSFIFSQKANALPLTTYRLTPSATTVNAEAGTGVGSLSALVESKSIIGGWNDFRAILGAAAVKATVTGGAMISTGSTGWGTSQTVDVSKGILNKVEGSFSLKSDTVGTFPVDLTATIQTTEGERVLNATVNFVTHDTTAPVVTNMTQAYQVHNGVEGRYAVTLTFNEAIDTSTLEQGWYEVAGSNKTQFTKIYYTPKQYTANFRDLAGNPVAYTFTVSPVANNSPVVSFVDPTPAENSYVRGTISAHVTATDDYGMGSYYVRVWKGAFESGSANLVKNDCYSAPGAFLLGLSQDVTCAYDTTTNSDGVYVLSAQFLDGNNAWGSQLRTVNVDNTKPNVSIKTGAGVNDGTTGKDGTYSQVSFKLNDPNGGLSKVVLNGHEYTRTNEWNDLNWSNITKSDLIEGTNTIYAVDRAGNQSDPLTFIYDKTAPTITVKDNYVGSLADKLFSNVSFALYDAYKVDKYVINGYVSDFSDNQWSDANFANIKSHLVQGSNTFTLYDVAGNSSTYTFNYDSVAPTATLSYSPSTLTNGNVTVTLTASEPIEQSALTGTWLKVSSTVYKKVFPANATQAQALKDAAGNIGSATVVINWIDKTPPSVPKNLSFVGLSGHVASGNPTNSQTGTLSWQDDNPSDVDKYVYKFWTNIPGYFEGYANAWTTSNPSYFSGSSIWTNFDQEGTYYFCVEAVDAAGNASACSDTYSVVYDKTAPGVPVPVTPFNNAIQNVNSFWFDWNDVADAVSYEAQFSQSDSTDVNGALNSGVWSGDANHNQPTESRAWSTGANGTWYWQVRAIDAAGNKSAWSAPWKLTIDMEAPSAPVVSATGVADGETTNSPSVDINWTKPSDDTAKYDYRVWTNAAGSSYNSEANAYVVNGLTGNSRNGAFSEGEGSYFVQVRAIDAAGNVSDWSDTFTVIYDATAPEVTLSTFTADGNKITPDVTATDAYGPLTYAWSGSNANVTLSATDVAQPTFTVTADGTYSYTLTVTDAAGNSTTKTFTFTYTAPVVNPLVQPASIVTQTTAPTGNGGFTNVALSDGNDEDAPAVAGASTKSSDTSDKDVLGTTAEPQQKSTTDSKFLGLSWYWWLPIVVAGGGLAWWLAALTRRNGKE